MTGKQLASLCFLLVYASRSWAQNPNQWIENYNKAWTSIANMAASNATFARLVDEHFKAFNTPASTSKQIPFSCDLRPSFPRPTSAHSVRPGDINVIGSLGDSITAGYGITATNILEVILNDRQESWIPGGIGSLDEGVMTVTNVLKKFNPTIQGFSFAESYEDEREAGLNVAVGGAVASDLFTQAEMLVNKMRDPAYFVDWEADWKLISLLIGGNDLCRACNDPGENTAELYTSRIQRALDYLIDNGPPRMIVVLSNIFDITPLPAFSDGFICDIVQWFVCSCAEETVETRERQRQYSAAVAQLVSSGRYDRPERPDFTVILMTHFDEALPPTLPVSGEVDRSFWSPDCFHPGRKGHYALATSQWNQLFEPVGGKRKTLDWTIGGDLHCPTEQDPFIKTNLNSVRRSAPRSALTEVDPSNRSLGQDEPSAPSGGQVAGLAGGVIAAVALLALVLLVVKMRGFPRRKGDSNKIADTVYSVEMKTESKSSI